MRKDLLIIASILLLITIFFTGTKFQSVEEFELTHIDDIKADSEIVTLAIDSKSLVGNEQLLKPELREFVPKDGIILKRKEYVLRNGDTVFDVLQRATRFHKIQLEFQGANDNVFKSAYIQGINFLYEFSAGANSGWMYEVKL